ncbi:harmonin-like [Acanthaster planci]|uniref:Harmonin-like n=1 Tax=Acanthaster planci TaxID=133434 RepID=A0A8B7YX61_ACAPL|nr:harmonin-like [Acanthaster planci]
MPVASRAGTAVDLDDVVKHCDNSMKMEGLSRSSNFKLKLSKLIEAEPERDKLYQCLRDYQLTHEIQDFVDALKSVIVHPDSLALFEDVRSFIQPSQQILYSQLIPPMPSKKLRTVRLIRRGKENLGFALRGGVEFGVGMIVSEVVEESQAARKGLKVGDEIVRLNGYNISQATHNEVISTLGVGKTLTLKVRSIGMVPMKNEQADPVKWKLVIERQVGVEVNAGAGNDKDKEMDRKVFVNLRSGKKLGCGIGTGQKNEPGIFIFKISPGSMAETLNFKIGDQILDVNGTSFLNISHDAAVMELKSSSQLTITLRSKKRHPDVGRSEVPVDEESQLPSETERLPTESSSTQPEAWWDKNPYSLFTHRQIDGRKLSKIEIVKDMPLEMLLEGGIDSPLAGRVVIAEVYEGGSAERSGQFFKGDQLMMVDGKSMIDIPLTTAQDILKEAMVSSDGAEVLRLITAVSPVKNYEDELTFF